MLPRAPRCVTGNTIVRSCSRHGERRWKPNTALPAGKYSNPTPTRPARPIAPTWPVSVRASAKGKKNGVFRESLDKERAIGLKQRQTLRRVLNAGVKMIFRTDAGVYPNGNNALQFSTMDEWGMTPPQAIQAATVSAGEALGRSGDVGAIAVGRHGDVIAVKGDPLADVKLLRSVGFVMKGREVVRGVGE